VNGQCDVAERLRATQKAPARIPRPPSPSKDSPHTKKGTARSTAGSTAFSAARLAVAGGAQPALVLGQLLGVDGGHQAAHVVGAVAHAVAQDDVVLLLRTQIGVCLCRCGVGGSGASEVQAGSQGGGWAPCLPAEVCTEIAASNTRDCPPPPHTTPSPPAKHRSHHPQAPTPTRPRTSSLSLPRHLEQKMWSRSSSPSESNSSEGMGTSPSARRKKERTRKVCVWGGGGAPQASSVGVGGCGGKGGEGGAAQGASKKLVGWRKQGVAALPLTRFVAVAHALADGLAALGDLGWVHGNGINEQAAVRGGVQIGGGGRSGQQTRARGLSPPAQPPLSDPDHH
jgi:hypothetical protein